MSGETAEHQPCDRFMPAVVWWRRLQGVGGLLLACCFFLPAIKTCGSPDVPAEYAWGIVADWPPSAVDWAVGFLWFVAAYLFGLLTFIFVLRNYRRGPAGERAAGVPIAVLLGIVIVLVSAGLVVELVSEIISGGGVAWELGPAILLALVLVSAVYWLRGVWLGPVGLLSLRWYGGVLCLVWFGFWLVSDPGATCYGLWLSLAGAAGIIVGTFGEAKVRTRFRAWPTLGRLFACRLKLRDLDGPRCRKCEYLLIGLTTPRCPECGTPFEWNEHAPDLMRPL